MRIGFALPQIGTIAGPDAVTRVARRAEELGFHSVWVLDRLLYPLNPRVPYPVGDGSLPLKYKRVLDPVETLTFAAARTERIAVGTSVLNLPWYNPVLLARRLATLDVLSGGRLRVGLGIGWLPEEFEAAGSPWNARGKRADAIRQVTLADEFRMFARDEEDIAKSFLRQIAAFHLDLLDAEGHAQDRIIAREPAVAAIVDALVRKIKRREEPHRASKILERERVGLLRHCFGSQLRSMSHNWI